MREKHNPSRRDLLKLIGAAGLGALLLPEAPAHASGAGDPEHAAAMLYDATRCVGCKSCEVACKDWNQLPPDEELPADTSAYTWTLIKQYKEGETQSFRKIQCLHCLHPACAAVCTVGALRKTAEGPVVYDSHKCIGCRYCQYGCPYSIPKYQWDQALGLIAKCTMCADRQAEGMMPACVEACPVGALSFGTRTEMIKEAYSRIQQEPDRYVDHLYGEKEGGGTSVLHLSGVPFEKLGLPELDGDPVTEASGIVMNTTPVVATLGLAIFSGIHWFVTSIESDKEKES